MPAGRPSDYSQEVASDICGRLASGEPLSKICRDEDKPHISTVYRWMFAHEEFREMYARARDDQAETLADEIVSIADEPMIGRKTTTKANGDVETVEGDMVEHRKLRVDARKWVAAKLKPRKFGDSSRVEHSGTLTLEQLVSQSAKQE